MNRNKPFAVDIFQPCIIFGFPDNIKAGNPLDIQNIVYLKLAYLLLPCSGKKGDKRYPQFMWLPSIQPVLTKFRKDGFQILRRKSGTFFTGRIIGLYLEFRCRGTVDIFIIETPDKETCNPGGHQIDRRNGKCFSVPGFHLLQ